MDTVYVDIVGTGINWPLISAVVTSIATIALSIITYLYLTETRKMVAAANGPNIKCSFGVSDDDMNLLFVENLSLSPLDDFHIKFLDMAFKFEPYFGDECPEESFKVLRNIAQSEKVMYPLEFQDGVRYVKIQLNYTYNEKGMSQNRKLYYQVFP